MGDKTYSIPEVIQSLKEEFKKLNRTWVKVGDVNDIDFGGVRYRKNKRGNRIEVILYWGNANLPTSVHMENKYTAEVSLEDVIEQLEDVWGFADGENCGFDIGNLISSADHYNGFIRHR